MNGASTWRRQPPAAGPDALCPSPEATTCAICGIPVDAKPFDESGVDQVPARGDRVVLARFPLPPQYCGVLQYFSQFWSENAKNQSKIHTPGLQWVILSNGHPLYPYLPMDRILNPWGYGSFPVAIRLDENAVIEFAVRNLTRDYKPDSDPEKQELVGGRLVGRYWYNPVYGDVARSRA